jgi:predicted permease
MIANEYDMQPAFVTALVLFSTLASLLTLGFVIALL